MGQDIRNGIYTAPILFALADPVISDKIIPLLAKRDDISDIEMMTLHTLITESNAMVKLSDLLTNYTESLKQMIQSLPDEGIRLQLEQLSGILLNRKY